jgi:hypothetical protein
MAQTREYKVIDVATLAILQIEMNDAVRDGYEVVTAFPSEAGFFAAILVRTAGTATNDIESGVEVTR